jgi:small conductance mechanosensitive channel
MTIPLLLLTLTAFQLAPATPTTQQGPGDTSAPIGDATIKPPMPSASATLPAVKTPIPIDPAVKFKQDALNNFWSMNYQALGRDEWAFLAAYYGMRALFVIILMTLAWTASAWASSALRAALASVKFDETLSIFLAKLLRWAILLLVGMTCLSYFGVETTGFAAVIGAAGLAIGLAFQGTLSNFAAGAMLLIFRPYKVGDSVVVAGNWGTVAEIELFTTSLDTGDNRRIIIPNSSIFGAVIENHTANPFRRAEVLVGTNYAADIDATRAALNRAVTSVSLLTFDRKPEVALLDLGASSVNWAVRGWAKREALGDARQALIRAVKNELDRAGIGIPYPQLEIHLDQPPVQDRRAA